ncbi:MAG: pyruvate phosphate dikinase [Candidatus Midichloriaceae bacterium]|jgi:pyruvate,orthophosphate dikinase|nr:pyruvate phosphate dikinase [Candidatus Midichloriaceae bacterium]
MKKWVYKFGNGKAEGDAKMKGLLGGKGANLAELSNLGLPVPPGFTISAEGCLDYYKYNKSINADIISQVKLCLSDLGSNIGLIFGDENNPLLISVRSGASVSMPGMMDTILNIGLNDKTVLGLARLSGNERFAYDCYRRLIEMYSDVVLDVKRSYFEGILKNHLINAHVDDERNLSSESLKQLIEEYKKLLLSKERSFPQDPYEQLWNSITAVFSSWMNERAITYRKIHSISGQLGTAVNMQSMVFGNFGDDSATGVCFTRNPSTGEDKFYGEFMINAQGEDVVAGIRTPQQITFEGKKLNYLDSPSLEELMPEVYKELVSVSKRLESHFKDVQDIEFTIQNKKLWLLQTRNAKRSSAAAVKIAVDMVKEGIISKQDAILRVSSNDINNLLHPQIDSKSTGHKVICKGLPASPGAATGIICFNPSEVIKYKGQKVILVRSETSPEDIGGMHLSQGIITGRGGMTSHAAVVARGMGKPCVVGVDEFEINEDIGIIRVGDLTLNAGDKISINGATGEVIYGEVATTLPEISAELEELLNWCDEIRDLKIRSNSDTKKDAEMSRKFGAEGIGLCRTEHMFFKDDRIVSVRKMILAASELERNKALDELFLYQKQDFKEIFQVMNGLPVTVRLLDPPLHEFISLKNHEIKELAHSLGASPKEVLGRIESLKEANPMLGHRGCRLAVSYPEIYKMQARAILEASLDAGYDQSVEIMIPLVFSLKELEYCKNLVLEVANGLKSKVNYSIGTMIELPRAALMAGNLAKEAEFFSFGTNDLTQTTLGLSRDDSASFMQDYLDNNILAADPFLSIDIEGVGELIKIASKRGKNTNPKIKLGICGEHGGDPDSIQFFHNMGLDYVSCSPYRVPVARFAAAVANVAKAS